ncbi:MAG TPA: TlpA disulfide reductase family protein [Candidatus Eisenbacteria bacterium]|nr:TlpA disulfide reductase family protein [Candidatus Eisenbacteria bacterium]
MAVAATLVVVWLAGALRPVAPGEQSGIARGQPAPAIVGLTLDGAPFDLSTLRGHPVIVNFWGPGCAPCRDEFPMFKAKLAEHATDGLAIVGVLMFDAPAPARDFIAQYGATWPTVDDPGAAIRTKYRVVARPQSYFIDRAGILREIQVGQVSDADFERLYASISR